MSRNVLNIRVALFLSTALLVARLPACLAYNMSRFG